ncbi:MAG: serpin family protein [Planctomycetota bacterium]
MKRQIALYMIILGCLPAVCFGAAREYPAEHPVGKMSGWPNGLTDLVNVPQRVAGYAVNANYELFYKGTTEELNEFLQRQAKLEHSALWVTLHGERERKALLWNSKLCEEEYQQFGWKITIIKKGWFDGIFDNIPAEQDHIVAVDIWLDAGIDKDALVIPDGLPIRGSIVELPEKCRQEGQAVAKKDIVPGNTEFAFDLYQRLKEEDGNLFFSPYSISTALAMTYAGARGQTEKQMGETLHFGLGQEKLHTYYKHLINQLNEQGRKKDYQLSIANALWLQKDYYFSQHFIRQTANCYRAGLENVDFVNETEKSRQQINQWVEKRTEEKIKDLIPQGTLNALTRLVLTNAIYFKGDWAMQFDTKWTKEAPFYVSPEKPVTAPLMFQKDKFKYGENEGTQFLELGYKGDDLSMLVLLPKKGKTLAGLEKQLNAENLAAWQTKMFKKEVMVYLPRFKMTSQFGLSDTLKKMGMVDAFGDADFSGMDGTKMLYISAIMHKAFVEVNEEGTEAAAATAVVVGLRSMPTPPPVFRADRPFVFVIKDNNSGSILFVGRVTDPTKN